MLPAAPAAGPFKLSAYRSLVCWLVVSVPLLMWQYHRQHAARATVSFVLLIEGKVPTTAYRASLNGLSFESGDKSGVGQKNLTISLPDVEPFETNLFVWYEGKALRTIHLNRSRGGLEFDIAPAADRVEITGPASTNLESYAQGLIPLPVGKYSVRVVFARFEITRTVEVRRNETYSFVMKPGIAALRVLSEPGTAEFQLKSVKEDWISVKDSTPVTVKDLPTGEYELTIWQGDYRKQLPVTVSASPATNELNVQFAYAKLDVSSEPSDATIYEGDKILGKTPVTLTVQPGSYKLQITKPGFFGTNVGLTVSEKESHSVSVTLINAAYAEAMERARHELSTFSADYNRALAEVEKALLIQPGDGAALRLKRTIDFRQHFRQAKQFEQDRKYANALSVMDAALKLEPTDGEALKFKAELEKTHNALVAEQAETRLNRPEKVLKRIADPMRYQELFTAHTMSVTGAVETVRTGVIRALGRNPAWNVQRNEKLDTDTVVVEANVKSFGTKNNVVVVAGQTTDSEVVIHFKLFQFTLGENIQINLSGVSEDSYKPLHSKYLTPLRAPFIEKQRNREIQDLKNRIESELR